MIASRSRVSLSRRVCTALAALGLLFAATVASVTHSIAMPMMPVESMVPAAHHQAGDGMAAHDHGCDSMAAADDDPAMPISPCENGCLLCKSCSLASAVMPQHPVIADATPYRDYRLPPAAAPAGLAPTPPNEPPRL